MSLWYWGIKVHFVHRFLVWNLNTSLLSKGNKVPVGACRSCNHFEPRAVLLWKGKAAELDRVDCMFFPFLHLGRYCTIASFLLSEYYPRKGCLKIQCADSVVPLMFNHSHSEIKFKSMKHSLIVVFEIFTQYLKCSLFIKNFLWYVYSTLDLTVAGFWQMLV